MDRKTWIAITFSVIGLIAWQWYFSHAYPTPPPQAAAVSVASPTPIPLATATPAPKPADAAAWAPSLTPRSESLFTRSAEYLFNNDAGGIEKVLLYMHLGENHSSVFLNADPRMPIGAIGFEPGEVVGGFEMEADKSNGQVLFHRVDSDGLRIEKRFSLSDTGSAKERQYVVNLDVTFTNSGATPIKRAGYFVNAGAAAPIHSTDLPTYTRFDWLREGKMTMIDVNWFAAGSIPFVGIQTHPERTLYLEPRDKIRWVSVTSQYFCTILTAESADGVSTWARRFDTHKADGRPIFGMQGGMGLPGFTVEPGQSITQKFQIFAGPKDLNVLDKLGADQQQVMAFGMFKYVSVTLLWAMNSLHRYLGSYAAAIIVLTLIIKSLLWPLQNKATDSMRRMSALSPKMTELREKYKDDPQKMNEELMKLYREYGINPFGGCLPMFVQIPIFFGFYSMLGTAIELRNSSFLWVSDLSQPDTVGHLLGFPINVLPLVMAGTMLWQMAISPKSGDAVQQRVFYFMPVIFLTFAYNYASALALYWTTQNIFSIVQLYLTRNKPLPTLEKMSVKAKREAAGKKSKKRRP